MRLVSSKLLSKLIPFLKANLEEKISNQALLAIQM